MVKPTRLSFDWSPKLGVPPRDVALVSGATGRLKRLLISGDGPTLVAALEKIVPPR
jgi:uncharacterized protein YggU (UPF0235/DUF167 family)